MKKIELSKVMCGDCLVFPDGGRELVTDRSSSAIFSSDSGWHSRPTLERCGVWAERDPKLEGQFILWVDGSIGIVTPKFDTGTIVEPWCVFPSLEAAERALARRRLERQDKPPTEGDVWLCAPWISGVHRCKVDSTQSFPAYWVLGWLLPGDVTEAEADAHRAKVVEAWGEGGGNG